MLDASYGQIVTQGRGRLHAVHFTTQHDVAVALHDRQVRLREQLGEVRPEAPQIEDHLDRDPDALVFVVPQHQVGPAQGLGEYEHVARAQDLHVGHLHVGDGHTLHRPWRLHVLRLAQVDEDAGAVLGQLRFLGGGCAGADQAARQEQGPQNEHDQDPRANGHRAI